MANSKFDMSLLKPINEQNAGFESQLKPLDEEEDEGAYLDSLPKPEGFLSKLPRNIIVGLASQGHSLLNAPHNLIQNLENQSAGLSSIMNNSFHTPKEVQERINKIYPKEQFKLSEHIPYQEEHNFAQMLGQKGEGTLMDKLIQKGIEYSPEIAGGASLLRGGFRRLKGTHQFDEMRRLAHESGVQVPLSPELADQARNFLANSHANREMLHEAQSGNFPASFATQSQIGHHQRNLQRSPLASERLIAPEVRDLKQAMLNHYEGIFRNAGRDDIADMMRSGINNYRRYKQFMEIAVPIAKKLKVPTSGLSMLGLGFYGGKKLVNKYLD